MRGERAVVRLTTPERLKAVDEWLWTFEDAAFIPHGRAGGDQGANHGSDQPVWLTMGTDNPAEAGCLFIGEGADLSDFADFRVCAVLFDGRVEAAVSQARTQWAAVKKAADAAAALVETRDDRAADVADTVEPDHVLSYWRQNERGGWEKAQ